MKTKFIYLLIMIFCNFFIMRSEDLSLPSVPPSPDAAALGKYGQYPVALYNGLVQIDIPIYTIQLPLITLPVSLSYHASGIKVDDISTSVGLGWVLNGGGIITRSVKGAPDNNFGTAGTIHNKQWAAGLSEDDRLAHLSSIYSQESTGTYDSESDVYYYNVAGLSGSFRFDINKNLIQIPLTNNIITYDSGGDFFRITGNDGTIYHFESKEKSTIQFEGSNRQYTSSWYLTWIRTTDNREIDFEYMTDNTVYLDKYVSYALKVPQTTPNLSNLQCMTQNFRTDNTLLIKAIKFPDGTITFSYSGDRADRRKYRLTGVDISNKSQLVKSFSLEHGYFSPSSILSFSQVQPATSYNSNFNYRLKLNKLKILDALRSKVGEYNFDYNTNALLPAYLDASSITSYATGTNQRYFGQDLWGYYNGVTTNKNFFTYSKVQSYNLNEVQANRSVNSTYAQACILDKITYPTGGYTEFSYESNKYSSGENAGGLRIKSVTSYSLEDPSPVIHSYQYEQGMNHMTGWTQIQGSSFTQGMSTSGSTGTEMLLYDYYTSEPNLPLSHSNGASVYYGKVIEYEGTPQTSNGKTEYSFLYSSNDVEYMNQSPCIMPHVYNGPYQFIPKFDYLFIDRGWTRGFLSRKSIFTKSGTTFSLAQQVNYTYTTYKKQSYTVGFKSFPNFQPANHSLPTPYSGSAISTNELFQYTDITAETGLVRLTKVEDISYHSGQSVTQSTTYNYERLDNQYEVTSTQQTTSNGAVLKKSFQYPKDINTTIYKNMADKNMLSLVIITTESVNNNFLQETQTTYSSWLNSFIAPASITEQRGSAAKETRVTYHNYDSKGNVLYASRDNSEKTVYLWGYNYQYLVAKIENATYDQVVQAMSGGVSTINSIASSNSPNISAIDALRSSLPEAMVTTYIYKPLVGLIQMTNPQGIKTTYEYDNFGRLINIKENGGHVIKNFNYNYRNQ